MKFIKLTTLFAFLIILASCEKENGRIYTNNNIPLNGSQEVPANQSPATGKMSATYNSGTRLLEYTVTWSGLTPNATTDSVVSGMHIHGIADPGFNAPIVQNIIASGSVSNGVTIANPGPSYRLSSGSISGRLVVDGVVIKEADLLSGRFYINIHTLRFPGGEIRGQITF